jgi:hypothetical protein
MVQREKIGQKKSELRLYNMAVPAGTYYRNMVNLGQFGSIFSIKILCTNSLFFNAKNIQM